MARAAAKLLAAFALLVLAVLLALSFGSEPTSLSRVLFEPASMDRLLVVEARLPRTLLAALAGGGLAVVGVAFQALLRNPLAEPYVLGVSGGAALGASVAIVLGLSTTTALGAFVLPATSLAGGLGATGLVYVVARASGSTSGTTILLAGVIVNALAGALITFLKSLVTATKAQELLFWLMGFLDVPAPASLAAVAVFVLGGSAVLLADAGNLNLLALGEEPASHLGVDVERLSRRVFFASSAIVGAIVSVTGLIGFVGLVVPHALRRLSGPDHRMLLPLSMLTGAAALVVCDVLGRVAFRFLGTEPPVGAITAVVGGPVFLALLVGTRQRG